MEKKYLDNQRFMEFVSPHFEIVGDAKEWELEIPVGNAYELIHVSQRCYHEDFDGFIEEKFLDIECLVDYWLADKGTKEFDYWVKEYKQLKEFLEKLNNEMFEMAKTKLN